jgi:hypothetical protein
MQAAEELDIYLQLTSLATDVPLPVCVLFLLLGSGYDDDRNTV